MNAVNDTCELTEAELDLSRPRSAWGVVWSQDLICELLG